MIIYLAVHVSFPFASREQESFIAHWQKPNGQNHTRFPPLKKTWDLPSWLSHWQTLLYLGHEYFISNGVYRQPYLVMLFKEDEDGSRNEAPSVQSAEEWRNLAFGGFVIEKKWTFSALF